MDWFKIFAKPSCKSKFGCTGENKYLWGEQFKILSHQSGQFSLYQKIRRGESAKAFGFCQQSLLS